MSEAETTQPVVQTTDAPAVQGAEVTVDARNDGDDLEKLLSEFDQHDKSKPAAASPKPEPGPEVDFQSAVAEVRQARDEIARDKSKKDMQDLINDIRGDLPADVFDDSLVDAWANARAKDDVRLQQAWVQRHDDPKTFKRVAAALGKEFARKFSQLPDKQLSEDRASVAAAVRGASTRAPEAKAPNFAAMSDNDFQAEKDKLFGN